MLKNIIHKQHIQLSSKKLEESKQISDSDSETESDTDSDESDYSDSEGGEDNIKEEVKDLKIKPTTTPQFSIRESKPQRNIYYNNNLKEAFLKKKLSSKKIDAMMVKMKITPKTKITKELITKFLNNIKK